MDIGKEGAARYTPMHLRNLLEIVRLTVGSKAFNSRYMLDSTTGEVVDVLGDGQNSCACFVSSILLLVGLQDHPHSTIGSTRIDMIGHDWQLIQPEDGGEVTLQAGDVLIWSNRMTSDGPHGHIGFYIGSDLAVSASGRSGAIATHPVVYNTQQPVAEVWRYPNWEPPEPTF